MQLELLREFWILLKNTITEYALKNFMKEIIEGLEGLLNSTYESSIEFMKNGYKNEQLAVDHFGRIISCLLEVKMICYSLEKAVEGEKNSKEFIDNCLPASFPKTHEVAQRYLIETNTGIRFLLFQNYFSQVEFTYRIIKRNNGDTNKLHPFNYIHKTYGLFEPDFVRFMRAIRNTIHNNGFYFPDDNKEPFVYNFNGKDFNFRYGERFKDITIMDIFQIIEFLNAENKRLFNENPKEAAIMAL